MSAALSEAEKTDTRRYLGYPVYGDERSGNAGWRYFQSYGALEYRLLNLTASELVVLRRYLGTLAELEQAIPAAGASLDTASAMGWSRNSEELEERGALFDGWCRRLAGFLGVPVGPAFAGGGGVAGISFVV